MSGAGPLLEATDLEIRFGGVIAADGVDMQVHEGRNLAIIGPNGAGKTTFLNICTGWLKPSRGTVRFRGRDITRLKPRQITRAGIARAFQHPQLFTEHTALENMLIAASARTGRQSPFASMARLPERGEMMHLLDVMGCADVA